VASSPFLAWSHERSDILFSVLTDLLRLLPGAAAPGLGELRRRAGPNVHGPGTGDRSAAQAAPLAPL